MSVIRRTIRRFARSERGVAALEFALISPFLLVLLLGGYELSRYIVVQQKTEKMAYAIADLTAQYETLGSSDISTVFSATSQIMLPYSFGTDGLAYLSSVYKDPTKTKPTVSWQCKSASSSLTNASTVGTAGGNASLPGSLLIDDKDNIIVSEVYYKFTPLFKTLWTSSFIIHRTAVFRPRLGALTSAPGC